MKSLGKMFKDKKGFTLIELLIVVVILGILSAVAAVMITRFIGAGQVEAANEELHEAKLAVSTAKFDGSAFTLDGAGPYRWDGSAGQITAGGVDPSASISGLFKARYTFSATGELATADLTLPAGRIPWSGIVWNAADKNWAKP